MFRLEVETGNAAFGDDPGVELARILRDVADKLEGGSPGCLHPGGFVRDVNGNRVGSFGLTPDEGDVSNG